MLQFAVEIAVAQIGGLVCLVWAASANEAVPRALTWPPLPLSTESATANPELRYFFGFFLHTSSDQSGKFGQTHKMV